MKTITLNNGVEMPQLGLGTFLIPNDVLPRVLAEAYEMGYRQFDTAWRYNNETTIASTFKKAGIKRENVFITTKINIDACYFRPYRYGWRRLTNVRNFKSYERIVQESFDNLQTDYVDLFLVHFPWWNLRQMYAALDKFYRQGRIRAIGVSSFLPPQIEILKEVSDIVPAVNQFEISPLNTQKPMIEYCRSKGIAVEAMSTFSHFRSNEPRKEIIENPVIREIGKKYGKSVVQVVLRWLLQQDIIMIPKTHLSEHLKENISIFDFELTPEEMAVIDAMDRGKCLNYDSRPQLKYLPKKYRDWDGF